MSSGQNINNCGYADRKGANRDVFLISYKDVQEHISILYLNIQ